MVDFNRVRSTLRPFLRLLGVELKHACEFDRVQDVGDFLRKRFCLPVNWNPEKAVGVVLGSGLGDWVDSLEGVKKLPFVSIPGFPQVHVVGHAGNFCFAMVNGIPVFIMQGRVHCYEGYEAADVVLGVRVMIQCLGVTNLILTNAAGGISDAYSPGDLVFCKGHINWSLPNPLVGPNDERLGTRFPGMSKAYHQEWRQQAYEIARQITNQVHTDGVYVGNLGPCYETPEEIVAFGNLGGTLAGMSTVPEVIAAIHAGLHALLVISCVTNKAASHDGQELSHDDVKEMADRAKPYFMQILTAIITATLP